MAVVTSFKLLERIPGELLLESLQPTAPTATAVIGQDKINVGWSKASTGGTPAEEVVVQFTIDGLTDVGWFLDIIWGDGETDRFAAGWSADIEASHTYTSSTPVTILAEFVLRYSDVVYTETIDITPNLGGDFLIDQVQIEKYQNGVLIYEPDWKPISKIEESFVDDRVNRAFSYRYRYRLRSVDSKGQPLVTSQFSDIIEQPSWS